MIVPAHIGEIIMNVSDYADLADIIAALGVIGSLLFLAFQVRQNTRTVRNQHWESHLDRLANSFGRQLDDQVASVIDKGRQNYDDLSGQEKIVFNAWASEYLANVFSSIGFYKQHILDPDTAVMGERRLEWFFKDSGASRWWRDPVRHPVPANYEKLINNFLSGTSATVS